MDRVTKIKVAQQIVFFICLIIIAITLILFLDGLNSPYSFLETALDWFDYVFIIIIAAIFMIVAKYWGEVAIITTEKEGSYLFIILTFLSLLVVLLLVVL